MKYMRLAPVIAACWLSSTAHASDVAQAVMTLSGLTYQAVDLTPGDSHAAGVTVSSTYNTRLDVSQTVNSATDNNSSYYAGNLFDSSNQTITMADGSISSLKVGNSLSTLEKFSSAEAIDMLGAPSNSSGFVYYGRSAAAGTYNEGMTFYLAPQSALVISGFVSMQGQVDGSSLLDTAALQAVMDANASISIHAGSYIDLALLNSDGSLSGAVADDSRLLEFSQSSTVTIDSLGHIAGEASGPLNLVPFTLRFSNNTDQTVLKNLNVFTTSGVDLRVIPVPEPSAWALFSLGLMGVCRASARQRKG